MRVEKCTIIHCSLIDHLFLDIFIVHRQTYLNPVFNANHPDPGVLKLKDGSYVAVTTADHAVNTTDGAYPILSSPDLITWTQHGYVFPKGKFR